MSKSTDSVIISAASGGDLRDGIFTYGKLEAMENDTFLKLNAPKKIVSDRVKELSKNYKSPHLEMKRRVMIGRYGK